MEDLQIKIRLAEPRDVDALCYAWEQSWLATYINDVYNITKEDILALGINSSTRKESLKLRLAEPQGNTYYFVAEFNAKVVGFISVHVGEENWLKVGALYILPDQKKKGIGKALLLHVLKKFEDKRIWLEIATYNESAIQFYKHFGFTIRNPDKIGQHKVGDKKFIPTFTMYREMHIEFEKLRGTSNP